MKTPYWARVIHQAKARAGRGETPFSEKHIRLAKDWVTCACGKQDARIPRYTKKSTMYVAGMPKDELMADSGSDFYHYVRNQNPFFTGQLLAEVEDRAAELILEESP